MENNEVMRQPFFSVCIPVYNTEKYLDECMASVLKQTESDYEIILVDDGSRDKSGEMCDRYASQYSFVRVIHKENQGLFLARFDAVRNAKGKYLLFLDSDDIFLPGIMAELKNKIQQTNADIIVFDWVQLFSSGTQKHISEKYENLTVFEGNSKIQFCYDLIKGASLNSVCKKCIRRDLYNLDDNLRQYIGLNQGEDKIISLFCIDKAEKILYLKQAFYGYRMNEQSITHNITRKNYDNVQITYQWSEFYVDKWKLPQEIVKDLKRKRLEFSYTCIRSIILRTQNGKFCADEWEKAVDYISDDPKYQSAFQHAHRALPLHKRILSILVARKQKKLIWMYCKLIDGGKRLLYKCKKGDSSKG